jgi:cytochrome d ubiquinol oxidase subunit II
MAGTILMCVMAALGARLQFVSIRGAELTIWESAAATSSLMFVFWGIVLVVPAIAGYTVFVYLVFRGKATGLSYGQGE